MAVTIDYYDTEAIGLQNKLMIDPYCNPKYLVQNNSCGIK